MVSLQACLTGLALFRRTRRLFFGAAFRAHANHFFPTAPVQDVHVLGDAVQALLQLFQQGCRRVRVGARRTSRVPPLIESRLDAMLHLLQLQRILPLDGTPLVQRAPTIQRLGGCGSDCRGGKPVPQGERPVDGVFSLHPTEQVAIVATEPLGRTGRLSLEPALLDVSCLGDARSNCCLSGRLSFDSAV